MGTTRPNILFFFTDDQRFNTINALGNGAIRTPNIDKLVARGTTFTHAHIPGGTVGAVCMPSRAMLHTGRTLYHVVDSGERIPCEHTTMGEAFRAGGYRTFGTGKWHNGREAFHRGYTDGDDILFDGMADHWNVPVYHFDPTGRYDTVMPKIMAPQFSNARIDRECDHIHYGKHSSQMVCDAAINFINTYDSKEPFFAYVSFLAPHDPRTMPKEYLEMYNPEEIELPPNYMGGHIFDNGYLYCRDEALAAWPRKPKEIKRHIAEYYGMISHLDAQLGRVVTALEATGILDNTIIVFAGDNGLALGQHGLMGKQNLYDHSVRVPLILAGPGIPEGERRDALVYLLDIFPTLCELTGVTTPASVEGQSMVASMQDATLKTRETLYFTFREFQRGVRNEHFKLIEYVVEGEHNMTQLFDLANDPWELANLAADPAYAGVLRQLRLELQRYSIEWGDRETSWGKVFWPVYDASVQV